MPCQKGAFFFFCKPVERFWQLSSLSHTKTERSVKREKTYLKSWRDKQTYKSKKQALIQVRSWWKVLSYGLHKNAVLKEFFFLLILFFIFFFSSHFASSIWITFFLSKIPFSSLGKSCLFNDDDIFRFEHNGKSKFSNR